MILWVRTKDGSLVHAVTVNESASNLDPKATALCGTVPGGKAGWLVNDKIERKACAACMDKAVEPPAPKVHVVEFEKPNVDVTVESESPMEVILTEEPQVLAVVKLCKRSHSAASWKVTPKGIRYCTECYKELRAAQKAKKGGE